jgi:hypothetical protein
LEKKEKKTCLPAIKNFPVRGNQQSILQELQVLVCNLFVMQVQSSKMSCLTTLEKTCH